MKFMGFEIVENAFMPRNEIRIFDKSLFGKAMDEMNKRGWALLCGTPKIEQSIEGDKVVIAYDVEIFCYKLGKIQPQSVFRDELKEVAETLKSSPE
jgi:hypothetical protein